MAKYYAMKLIALDGIWLGSLLISIGTSQATLKLPGVKQGTECFKELGCFNATEPWFSIKRPFPLPQSPNEIQTTFYLSTRENVVKHLVVSWPTIILDGLGFDPYKPTVFIVHGFASQGDSPWITEMTRGYLKNVDANVFVVDWGHGANKFNYFQVASNIRVVGAELSRLGKFLVSYQGLSPKLIHCIGHSLGAHACGYFGKEMKAAGLMIDWITALDPAQPGFEFFPEAVRVSHNDASFIDAIHTDSGPFIPLLGFGFMEPIGHVDFYANGGVLQPGCPTILDIMPPIRSLQDLAKFMVEEIAEWIKCPHSRAQDYYISSLTDCTFRASPFKLEMNLENNLKPENLLKNLTISLLEGMPALWESFSECSNKPCAQLGLEARNTHLRGSFYVGTSEKKPYCMAVPESMPASLFRLAEVSGVNVKDIVMNLYNRSENVEDRPKDSANRRPFQRLKRWFTNATKKTKAAWQNSKKAVPNLFKGLAHWFKHSKEVAKNTLQRPAGSMPNPLKEWLEKSSKETQNTWKKLKDTFSHDLGRFKRWIENSNKTVKGTQKNNDKDAQRNEGSG